MGSGRTATVHQSTSADPCNIHLPASSRASGEGPTPALAAERCTSTCRASIGTSTRADGYRHDQSAPLRRSALDPAGYLIERAAVDLARTLDLRSAPPARARADHTKDPSDRPSAIVPPRFSGLRGGLTRTQFACRRIRSSYPPFCLLGRWSTSRMVSNLLRVQDITRCSRSHRSGPGNPQREPPARDWGSADGPVGPESARAYHIPRSSIGARHRDVPTMRQYRP